MFFKQMHLKLHIFLKKYFVHIPKALDYSVLIIMFYIACKLIFNAL